MRDPAIAGRYVGALTEPTCRPTHRGSSTRAQKISSLAVAWLWSVLVLAPVIMTGTVHRPMQADR